MYDLKQILMRSIDAGASDIHFTVGRPPCYRVDGVLSPIEGERLTPEMLEELLLPLMDERHREEFDKDGQTDFAYAISGVGRFRVNVFQQRGTYASVMRCLPFEIPQPETLGIPKEVVEFTNPKRGLVLVTGPTGSCKSTTLASLLHVINQKYPYHIITLEDPIEYLHRHDKSIVNQREIGSDSNSYGAALRAALREDPDVILVGEMRDLETISTAITAAETGHLVMSTLHTTGAAQTIDRIIDACPAGMQNQVRTQLANVLNGVITQCLIPNARGNGRVVATEILVGTDAVCNQIRENKCHQLGSLMQSGSSVGMHTLNGDLSRLVQNGMINRQMAYKYSNDVAELDQYL